MHLCVCVCVCVCVCEVRNQGLLTIHTFGGLPGGGLVVMLKDSP